MRGDNNAALETQRAWMAPTTVPGAHLFVEAGQTWAENLTIAQQQESTAYPGSTAIFDVGFPIATPTQPLAETIAGTHDAVITQIGQVISRMCKNAYIPIRPGHEGNHRSAFPAWTYNKDGGAAPYKAAMRRVIGLLKAVDPRFRFTWCLVPTPTKWDASFNWQDGYPGDDMIDLIGVDPYFVTSQGLNQQQDILRKIAGSDSNLDDGFNAFYAFAQARGKGFCFPEFGLNEDGRDWFAGLERWCAGKKIAHAFYWDKNVPGQADFACKLTDDSKPIAAKTFKKMLGSGSAWAAQRDGTYHPLNALAGKLLAFWQFDRDDLVDVASGTVTGARDMVAYFNALQATAANQPAYAATWAGSVNCLAFDGSNDFLSIANSLASGAADIEVWALVQNEATDTTTQRTLMAIGGGTYGTQIRISKRAADGFLQMVVGTGGTGTATVVAPQASGPNRTLFRGKVGPTASIVEVDGVASAAVSAVPAITAGSSMIGALSGGSNPWQGKMRDIYVTQALTNAEANQMRNYLLDRR